MYATAKIDIAGDRKFLHENLNDQKRFGFVMEVDEMLYNLVSSTQPLIRLPFGRKIKNNTIPWVGYRRVVCLKCGWVSE